MKASAERPSASRRRIEVALRDLGLAEKSLQLYPPGSRVVRDAVNQAFRTLEPLLADGTLILDVHPTHVRTAGFEIGDNHAVIARLARRLHRHGIARLAFDDALDADSLQRFVAVIARDRRDLDAGGGIEAALRESRPTGVHAELLELERLFEEGEGDRYGDIWNSLLSDFSDATDSGPLDWRALMGSSRRLQEFVDWFGRHLDQVAERSGCEQVDVLRHVVERMARIAGELGSEHVSMLALTLRSLVDTLEPGVLAELLADPMEVEVSADPDGETGSPEISVREFLEGVDIKQGTTGELRKTLDITRIVAQGLTTEQAESLIFHVVSATAQSSPRLYRLFDRVLDGRPDRKAISRQVRANLERALADTRNPQGFLAQWPKLAQVLDGEVPDRFVSADYGASLRALLGAEPRGDAWATDLIRPRLAEMEAGFVLRKKAHVLARVLDTEPDDEHYVACAAVLEDALHELIALDDYKESKRILGILVSHVEEGKRSVAQTRCASGVIERFYRPETLRQLVRNSLGRDDEVVDLIVGIIRIRGREVVPVLLDTLADEDTRRVRERLLKILPALGAAIASRVVERLGDDRWYVVRNLALILGELGSSAVVDDLGTLLGNPDERVRAQAVESMVKIGSETAESHLIAATEDRDDRVRAIAIHGLGYLATSTGRTCLRSLLRLPNLRGQNTPIVSAAAIALGRLRDTDSRAALERLARRRFFFRRRRRSVRRAAHWALEAIDATRVGPAPEPRYLAEISPSGTRDRPSREE